MKLLRQFTFTVICQYKMTLKMRNLQNIFKKYHHYYYPDTKIGFLGVPFDAGVAMKTNSAANLLRKHKIIPTLAKIHDRMEIVDYGDFEYCCPEDIKENSPKNMNNYSHVTMLSKHLSDRCKSIIRDGRKLLVIGGDHSLTIGAVDGHIRSLKGSNVEMALLCVDAYANLNTNISSKTGNIAGMQLAILVKELKDYWPKLPGWDWLVPHLSVRNVAYIGLRSIDEFERLMIDKFGIPAYGVKDVENFGIRNVTEMVLKHIDPFRNRSIHISFSIDALDTLEAPSTKTSVRGGLKLRECLHILELVCARAKIGGLDLVEINPEIGDEKDVETTAEAAILLCQAAFGLRREGMLPPVIQLERFQYVDNSENM